MNGVEVPMKLNHLQLGQVGSRFTLLLVCLILLGLAPGAGRVGAQSVAAPVDLTALAVSVREVDLAWSAPIDSVYSYTIRRNDLLLATVYGDVRAYIDTSIQPSSIYIYTVVALYTSWAESPLSSPTIVKTPALPDTPDTTPPSAPADLNAVIAGGAVFLDWQDATDDTDITAYQIRRDGLPLAMVNSGTLSYSDTTALPATVYVYSVEALDVMGQHSQPSNLATIQTPANPYPAP
jgi:fibronectin type 3 domain-containing protein